MMWLYLQKVRKYENDTLQEWGRKRQAVAQTLAVSNRTSSMRQTAHDPTEKSTTGLNTHFTRKTIQTSNRYINKCKLKQSSEECKLKPQDDSTTRMGKMRKRSPNTSQRRINGTLRHSGWECSWVCIDRLANSVAASTKAKHTHIPGLRAALFLLAKN